MRRGPRGTGVAFVAAGMLAAAWWSGCGLQTAGTGPTDGTPDLPDVVEVDVDVEAPEDDAGEDGAEIGCTVDDDCRDFTCVDGVQICHEGQCEQLEPMLCPNDGVSCTRDYCDDVSNACFHREINLWCGGGMSCDDQRGCFRTGRCTEDSDCSLGTSCEVDRCLEGGTICVVDGPDADGDTYTDAACILEGRGGPDCDDGNPDVHPDRPEICNNLIDDDCDRLTDYVDVNSTCTTNLGNDRCADAVRLVTADPAVHSVPVELGTTFGADGPPSACAYDGPDAWYRVEVTDPSDVTFDTIDAAFDTVLSLLDGCDGSELLCNDDRNDDPANGSRIVYRALPPGTYWIRVGAKAGGVSGSFDMHYDFAPTFTADCGNAIDATPGGTYFGRVTDSSLDSGSCALLSVGYKERFHVGMDLPANLTIDTTGTTFPHVLYVRDDCSPLSVELLCATGAEMTGTSETIPSFAGEVWLTLEFQTYGLTEVPPDGPYVVQINP